MNSKNQNSENENQYKKKDTIFMVSLRVQNLIHHYINWNWNILWKSFYNHIVDNTIQIR